MTLLDRIAEGHLSRIASLGVREDYTGALDAAEAMIKALPTSAAAYVAKAVALKRLGRFDEALTAAQLAVQHSPQEPVPLAETHAVRGSAMGDLLRFDEQIADLRIAANLNPARHMHSLAIALTDAGRSTEARAAFEKAIAAAPNNPAIRYRYSLLHLYQGDLEKGFAEYEWRLKIPRHHSSRYANIAPRWSGEDIAGKSLLIYVEQGLGDAIQFVRYLGPVIAAGANVSLLLQEPLRTIAAASFPDVQVISDARSRVFDYQVPLLSLAHVFQTRLDTIPSETPYLVSNSTLVAKWRERIGPNGFRIGVSWQGSPDFTGDRFRSVDPAVFAPLAAIPGVRLISLQAIHGLDKLDTLPPDLKIESFGDEIGNNPEGMSEIAALMASLDLVVAIDSAVAHLAGALARPVFVALRKQPEWRWMEGRSDSAWYPTMKLFRQADPLVWDDVFAAMAVAIKRLCR